MRRRGPSGDAGGKSLKLVGEKRARDGACFRRSQHCFAPMDGDPRTPLAVVACDGAGRGGARFVGMYGPALRTLGAGLRGLGLGVSEVHEAAALSERLSGLRAGDVAVWVGLKGIPQAEPLLANAIERGVFTVYYSTDALHYATVRETCRHKLTLAVDEVWEYSQRNRLECEALRAELVGNASRPALRYVPPGYAPPSQLVDVAASQPELVFFGGTSRRYAHRLASLASIRASLMASLGIAAAELVPEADRGRPRAACAKPRAVCTDACAGGRCAVRVLGNVSDDGRPDGRWAAQLRRSAFFLSLDKADRAGGSPCHSFRFAPLLSSGGVVLSERCHAADEAEWRGRVTFAAVGELPGAFLGLWRRRAELPSARQRAAAFAADFAPDRLFERAGVPAALARHRGRPSIQSLMRTSRWYERAARERAASRARRRAGAASGSGDAVT